MKRTREPYVSQTPLPLLKAYNEMKEQEKEKCCYGVSLSIQRSAKGVGGSFAKLQPGRAREYIHKHNLEGIFYSSEPL